MPICGPAIYSQVAGNEAIIAMVGMGCGVGIVPRLVLDKSPLQDQVDILEVAPPLEPFCVGACTLARNRRNPVVQSFWQILEMEVPAQGERMAGTAHPPGGQPWDQSPNCTKGMPCR